MMENLPKNASLEEQINHVSSAIRSQPGQASHRWALFQLLCITGEWARAIQQLQTWATLMPGNVQTAHVYRDLTRAESWRQKVFAKGEEPGSIFELPSWARDMASALRLDADGKHDEADDLRAQALETASATATPVRTDDTQFQWMTDSDTRLGPLCEILTAGYYRWVPFSDLASWKISQPVSLIDLVWTPCSLRLNDGSMVHGFMPVRYPGSETAGDSLRLGRKTEWKEAGAATVTALGRRTWMTSGNDFGIFELPACKFGEPASDGHIPQGGDRANDTPR